MSRNAAPMKHRNIGITLVVAFIIAALIVALVWFTRPRPYVSLPSGPFFAAIDTMKASRDTQTKQLSQHEVDDIVTLSASLNTNYITVDTNWDYPTYIQEWVDAIRATHHHVWFRSHPNKWENDNGATGIMTPTEYEDAEQAFIQKHLSLFQPGDIFDPCPEPEQGHYWQMKYQTNWTSSAPNDATRAFNAFIRDTSDKADAALNQGGIYGVITTIRSMNSFFATHPGALEKATVNKFQRITVDSYPDAFTTDPAAATRARVEELQAIENIWHLPIVVGELGYSNSIDVDDTTQRTVLKAEFDALAALPYIIGVNYWVGAGTNTSGGYTHIFAKSGESWSLRPAAYDLSAFYKAELAKTW